MEQRLSDLLPAVVNPDTGQRIINEDINFTKNVVVGGALTQTASGSLVGKWTVGMPIPDDGFSADPYLNFLASTSTAIVRRDYLDSRLSTTQFNATNAAVVNTTSLLNYPCIIYKGTNAPVRTVLNIFATSTTDNTDHDLIVLQTYKTSPLCLRNRDYNVQGAGAVVESGFFGASTASRTIKVRNVVFTGTVYLFTCNDGVGHNITVERCTIGSLQYYGGTTAADIHIFRHCEIGYFIRDNAAVGSASQSLYLENCTLGGVDSATIFNTGIGAQKMVMSNCTIRLVGSSKLFPDGYAGPYPRFANTILVDAAGNVTRLDNI